MNTGKFKASIVLLCYNQERTIKDSLISAINQNYSYRYKIIVCDDGSKDNTVTIINNIAKNNKSIVVLSSDKNEGIAKNFNKAIPYIEGSYFITQAGDDISLPNRLAITEKYLLKDNNQAFFSSTIDIDSKSKILNTNHGSNINERNKKLGGLNLITCILNEGGILGASAGYKTSIIKYGPLSLSNFSEDKILTARAASLGSIYFFNNALVKYRRGSGVSIITSHTYYKSMAKLMYRRNRFYKSIISDCLLSKKLYLIKNIDKKIYKSRLSSWHAYQLLKNKLPFYKFLFYTLIYRNYNNITVRAIYQFLKGKIHAL
ncbi:TPA: glycosyltransferase [Proteus mirabilis]|uniref:Gt1 n=1 Tax=Proteus genomosp. 4 TaxID=1311818 RepID=A0A385JNM8_9GAMM|nr:glycosyltransferase [Proteus genomosp. 4]AXY99907.1 gt1 [Proteus genomosp. 4]